MAEVCPQEPSHTRNVVGTTRETNVTKTIFTGSRKFIMLADSGEIISQSPKPQTVLEIGLNTYKVCPSSPHRMWSQLLETLQASWRLATLQS
jgi:hypothetical protein